MTDRDKALDAAALAYEMKQYGMADHESAFQAGADWQEAQTSSADLVAEKYRLREERGKLKLQAQLKLATDALNKIAYVCEFHQGTQEDFDLIEDRAAGALKAIEETK